MIERVPLRSPRRGAQLDYDLFGEARHQSFKIADDISLETGLVRGPVVNHPVIDFSNLLDDHYVAAGRRHFWLKQGRHKDLELERAAPRSVCIPIVPVIALSLAQEAGRYVLEAYVSEKAG